MQHRELFSLTVRHDYYLDRKCPDFTLSPTPECEQLLRNFRLVVKTFPFGILVLAPVRLEEQQSGGPIAVPFLEIPPDTRFDFWMKLNNPEFSTFTDLKLTYRDRKLARPVFSNTNLDGGGTLEVNEMRASRTEYLTVPEGPPRGAADFIVLLKDKPAKETHDLHIFLDPSNATIEAVAAAWAEWIKDNGPKDFSIEIMDEEGPKDITVTSGELEALSRPFEFRQENDTGGVRISYRGPGTAPKVRVVVLKDTNHPKYPPNNTAATFTPLPGQLTIYTKDTSTQGMSPIFWSDVLVDWKNVSGRQGFILTQLGPDKSKLVNDTGGFQPMRLQNSPQMILPTGNDNGIRITYTGDNRFPLVKISEHTAGTATFFRIDDEHNPFTLEGPAGIELSTFFKPANALKIAFTPQNIGQAFQLTYPVRPSLPWGVFGKVEIHHKPDVFADFNTENVDKKLFIRFIPTASYWAYYVVTEVPLTDTEISLAAGNAQITFVEDQATTVSFPMARIDTARDNTLQLATFSNNSKIQEANIATEDLAQILSQLLEIETKLGSNSTLDPLRFLILSDTKIPNRERYQGFLSLTVNNAGLDLDEVTDGSQPHKIDSMPLPMLGNKEVKLVRITNPEIIKPPPT